MVRDSAGTRIQVLGRFEIFRYGNRLPSSAWQSRKARDLLRILVARRGRPVARDELAELLWPEDDLFRVGHRLSTQLSLVRTLLSPDRAAGDCLVADRSSVALDLTCVQVDVEQFLAVVAQARQWQRQGRSDAAHDLLVRAEQAYGGDPFEDEPYLDATVALREEARATYLAVVRELAERYRAAGQTDRAVGYLLRLLARDRYDEPAHRALVETLVAGGRHGEARRAFARYAKAMREIDVPAPDRKLLDGHGRATAQ